MNMLNKLFSALKKSEETSSNIVNYEVTSSEQIEFANAAIEIFNPVLRHFGFNLLKLKITEYSSTVIWIKNKCYIDLSSNTHPKDAPNYYGILLGEFKEDYYHYSDLDCVGLWRLKSIQDNFKMINETPFPLGEDIKPSLIQTIEDLIKYGNGFLQGDLKQFYQARKIQWNK